MVKKDRRLAVVVNNKTIVSLKILCERLLFKVFQDMTHTVALGHHITLVEAVGGDFDGDILNDFEAETLQSDTLDGIVGQEPHLANTKLTEDFRANAIIPLVGVETKMHIGIHSVHTFFLEFVSLDFVEQTNAPALLVHIEEDALASLVNLLHCGVELVATVATETTKNVARSARRMYAHEDWLVGLPSTLDKCRMFEAIAQLTEYSHLKLSVFGGHHHFGAALSGGLGFQAIGNQIRDHR